jgi:hypothetical protein
VKTTIEIPDELLRRSKIKAAERGSTLKQLVIHGLEREIQDSTIEASEKDKHSKVMAKIMKDFRFTNTVSASDFNRSDLHEDR